MTRRASFKSMILIALSLLWGSAALNAAQKEFEGKCIKVYDGDSITLQSKQTHKTLKIRLYGIDAPELKQTLGKKSRDKLRELVLHKTLIVRVRGKDRYQRHIGEVFEGKILVITYMLSKGLVSKGLVWHYLSYDKSSLYARAEEIAKSLKLEVFAENANTLPPWDYRKQ